MPKDKGTALPYFVLKPAVSGDLLYSMLGRVVQDPRRPNGPADFAPPEEIVPSQIVLDLYRNPVPGKDIKTLKAAGHTAEAKLQLSTMIDAFIEANRTSTESRAAPIYKRWDIAQPKIEIQLLMRDPGYAASVTRFLAEQKDKKAALVVTVLALVDVEFSATQQSNLGGGGGAKVPLDTVVPSANVSGRIKVSRNRTEQISGTAQGQVVFALGYVEIKLIEREKKWYHLVTDFFGHELVGNIELSDTYINPETELYVGGSHKEGDLPYILGPKKHRPTEESDEDTEEEDIDDSGIDRPIELYF